MSEVENKTDLENKSKEITLLEAIHKKIGHGVWAIIFLMTAMNMQDSLHQADGTQNVFSVLLFITILSLFFYHAVSVKITKTK